MIDLIVGMGSQILWPIILILGGLLAAWGWGAKKKAEGKAAERERAREARDAAAKDAVRTRDTVAAKPIDQQRGDVERWEN